MLSFSFFRLLSLRTIFFIELMCVVPHDICASDEVPVVEVKTCPQTVYDTTQISDTAEYYEQKGRFFSDQVKLTYGLSELYTEEIYSYLIEAMTYYKKLEPLNAQAYAAALEDLKALPKSDSWKHSWYCINLIKALQIGPMSYLTYMALGDLYYEKCLKTTQLTLTPSDNFLILLGAEDDGLQRKLFAVKQAFDMYWEARTFIRHKGCDDPMGFMAQFVDLEANNNAIMALVNWFEKYCLVSATSQQQVAHTFLAILIPAVDEHIIPLNTYLDLCDMAGHYDVLLAYYLQGARFDSGSRQDSVIKVLDLMYKKENDFNSDDKLEVLHDESEEGNPYAAFMLALRYLGDSNQAMTWYIKAAQLGYPDALTEVYKCFDAEWKNPTIEITSLKPLAKLLGSYLCSIEGQVSDGDLFQRLLQCSVILEEPLAFQDYFKKIYACHVNGFEEKHGNIYNNKIASLEQTLLPVHRQITDEMREGFVSPCRDYIAYHANQGHQQAQLDLLIFLSDPQNISCDLDMAVTFCFEFWGNMSSEEISNMGTQWFNVLNQNESWHTYEKRMCLLPALEKASSYTIAAADYALARLYDHRKLGLYNPQKAVEYYEKALRQGHDDVLLDFTTCLLNDFENKPPVFDHELLVAKLIAAKKLDLMFGSMEFYSGSSEENEGFFLEMRKDYNEMIALSGNPLLADLTPINAQKGTMQPFITMEKNLHTLRDLNLFQWLKHPGFMLRLSDGEPRGEILGFLTLYNLPESIYDYCSFGSGAVEATNTLICMIKDDSHIQGLEDLRKIYKIIRKEKERKIISYGFNCLFLPEGDPDRLSQEKKIKMLQGACQAINNERRLISLYHGFMTNLVNLIEMTFRERFEAVASENYYGLGTILQSNEGRKWHSSDEGNLSDDWGDDMEKIWHHNAPHV